MKLAYKEMGEGQALIVLHGLFGSADNWQTLGKAFAEHFRVYLVDQRNHGHSPHSDDFNYDLLAEDLKEFIDEHGISKPIIIGHSMGGKTAMRFAQRFPELADKIIVADMGIKSYQPHHGAVLKAFHSVDLSTLNSRSEADDMLKPILPDFGTRQFILKSLYRKGPDEYAWRPNFKVLEREMPAILAALPHEVYNGPSLFLYGTRSDYVRTEDFEAIRALFPKAEFASLEAGHWLHAEKPREFYTEVMNFVT
jgi:pimeloyl-ACP methyl ester carboxylesterase